MNKVRLRGYLAAFTAAIGGFLQSYSLCCIAGALLFIGQEFPLTPNQEGFAASIIILGALGGSLFAGSLADRLGRRKMIFISSIVFVISNIPILFVPSFTWFLTFRFFSGIAIGITAMVIPLYLAEISPPKYRGAFVATFQLAVTLGSLIAYLVNLSFAGSENWRFMLFFTSIFASIQFFLLFFIPETPKWLMASGQTKKAIEVQMSLHSSTALPHDPKEKKMGGWKLLLQPIYRKGLFIGLCLMIVQQWVGINAIVYFAPKIFEQAGFNTPKSAIMVTFGLGCVNFMATLFSLFLIDRPGRRILLLISQAGVAITLICFSLFLAFDSDYHILIVIFSVLYLTAFAIGLGPIPWVLVSEIFPLAIRAHAIALMVFISWINTFLVVYSFPRFLASLGAAGSFTIYTIFTILTFFLLLKIVPETKGKTLEEIETALYK